MAVEERQAPGRVCAESIAHSGVETVIDVSEDQVEIAVPGAGFLDLADPLGLHAPRQAGTVVEKQAQRRGIRASGTEKIAGVEMMQLLESGANLGIHRCKASGIGSTLQRFEVKLGQVDSVPWKAVEQGVHAAGARRGSSRDSGGS